MRSVTVRHNFETAHRLYAGGRESKCWNLHGHSWWVEVEVTAHDLDGRGMVVEFGAFKAGLRRWIDTFLDHGAMLNQADPLLQALDEQGCKVMTFVRDPTVEAVAEMVAMQAKIILADCPHADGATISRVDLSETAVNAGAWCR